MTVTFSNSGSVQPSQGGEVECCTITGGPFAAVDAYVSGGSVGVQLEFRLYATVGTLRSLVATALYSGPPVASPAAQGSVLEWIVIGQGKASSPVQAGGTLYDLQVFGVAGAGNAVFCTLAGTNSFDAPVEASGVAPFPTNYGSNTIVTNLGCAQLADVGVDQNGLAELAFDVFVSCGAGSVEALVGTGQTAGSDGKSSVVRQLPLPVGTQYRLAVRSLNAAGQGNVTASLATYLDTNRGGGTPVVPVPSDLTIQRIHIVGDSNTFGSNGDGAGHVGGYRHVLYTILRGFRSNFDFIGSKVDAPESSSTALWFNDGHPGYKIQDVTADYAGWIASPGVGTPDVVLDMIGTNNIANGDSLALMQAEREAMDAVITQVVPTAKRIVLGVLPFVAGSTTGGNQAAWDAARVAYNTWLESYCSSRGYAFINFETDFGQGNYQSDGIHLNQMGQGQFGFLLSNALESTDIISLRSGYPYPRDFTQREPWYSLLCNGSGNGASVAGNAGFVPGAGSFIFTVDYYPTSLDAGALHTIAQYGNYAGGTPVPFWGLYQQGQAVRVYWANGSGTIFSMPCELALTLNRWHRIVIIADFSTLTVGLYVNGQCVGVAQGLGAWNITAGTFHLGDGPNFPGSPGYYSRVMAYAVATVPRPGTMAAQLAVELDYFEGGGLSDLGITGGYELNGSLTVGFYNQPALVLAGTAAFVAPYPGGTPLRPWELPGDDAFVSQAMLAQLYSWSPGLMQLTPGTAFATPGANIATIGSIRSTSTISWYARRSDGAHDMILFSLDGADNLTIGDPTWMGSVALYAIATTYLRTTGIGGDTYVAGDTIHLSDHALANGFVVAGGATPSFLANATVVLASIGMNAAGASLNLQAGAAQPALTLSNPSGSIVRNTSKGQTQGVFKTTAVDYVIDSAGAGDEEIWMTAACSLTLPNPTGTAGRHLRIVVNYDPSASGGTIKRHSGEKINGVSSDLSLTATDKYSILHVCTNGTDWVIKGGTTV